MKLFWCLCKRMSANFVLWAFTRLIETAVKIGLKLLQF